MSDIYTGGQMTDLSAYAPTTFDGTELFEIVAPGNVASGVNYSITTTILAKLLSALVYTGQSVTVTTGATSGSPYDVASTTSQVLINKTVGAATTVLLGLASAQLFPVLVKDLKGDGATNNITITFTSSEECDGLTEIVIDSNYGWALIAPVPGGGAWFLRG